MKTISVAKILGIGAAACLFGGAALAVTIPPKPQKLTTGPRARFIEARPDIPRGGPWVPPSFGKPVPAPTSPSDPSQTLGGRGSEGPAGSLRATGAGGAWGGTAVAETTPRQRVEQVLRRIAKELR